MKFLCLSCDEGMKLEAANGPREGSLEATFVCPRCHYKIIMLTNPWETQLVQTLGVKVGGRATPVSPYEQVLGSLVRPGNDGQGVDNTELISSGCPFAGMLEQVVQTESAVGTQWTDAAKDSY